MRIGRDTLCSIGVALGVLTAFSGCSPGGYDCVETCETDRPMLLEYAYRPDNKPLDEDTLCSRDAIVDARDSCECKVAYREEFRILPSELVCACPDSEDPLALVDEDCSYEIVGATADACATYESAEYQAQVAQCFPEN